MTTAPPKCSLEFKIPPNPEHALAVVRHELDRSMRTVKEAESKADSINKSAYTSLIKNLNKTISGLESWINYLQSLVDLSYDMTERRMPNTKDVLDHLEAARTLVGGDIRQWTAAEQCLTQIAAAHTMYEIEVKYE